MTTREETNQALEAIVDQLRAGAEPGKVVPQLKELLRRDPNHARVHYNLGIALSTTGELQEAVIHLKRAIQHEPENHHALTALGGVYAQMSKWPAARVPLEQAIKMAPTDLYAMRSLGTVLCKEMECETGVGLLRQAFAGLPDDEVAHLALAMGLCELAEVEKDDARQQDLRAEADGLLASFLVKYPASGDRPRAETIRSRLAMMEMRRRGGGGLRMDVVMYIAGAIKKFKALGPDVRQAVALEVSILGQNGLDINDSTQKYTLKSLTGEFSGLHLMALLYTALHQINPELDSGLDFSKEYAAAQRIPF